MSYRMQMETLWRGEWHPLALPLTVEADSHAAALAQVEMVALRKGVQYRVRVTGPDAELVTEPVEAPNLPTLPAEVGQ